VKYALLKQQMLHRKTAHNLSSKPQRQQKLKCL